MLRREAGDQVDAFRLGVEIVGEEPELLQVACARNALGQESLDLLRSQAVIPGEPNPVAQVDAKVVRGKAEGSSARDRAHCVVARLLGLQGLSADSRGDPRRRRDRPLIDNRLGNARNCRHVERVLLARCRRSEPAAAAAPDRESFDKLESGHGLVVDRAAEVRESLSAHCGADRVAAARTA